MLNKIGESTVNSTVWTYMVNMWWNMKSRRWGADETFIELLDYISDVHYL